MHDAVIPLQESERESAPLDVLLVSGDLELSRLASNALRSAMPDGRWSLRRVNRSDGDWLDTSLNTAACVIDGRSGADIDLDIWNNRGIPLILIVGDGERSRGLRAVLDGVQDYIESSELTDSRLRQAIQCAIQRHRFKHADEGRPIATDDGPAMAETASPVTSNLYGLGELRNRLPGDYRFLLAEYKGILERWLADVGLEPAADDARERLRGLVERLGALRATPRDIVDVHKWALAALLRDASDERVMAAGREARILLLEAIGYLAYYYRRYSVQLDR